MFRECERGGRSERAGGRGEEEGSEESGRGRVEGRRGSGCRCHYRKSKLEWGLNVAGLIADRMSYAALFEMRHLNGPSDGTLSV